MSEDRVIRVCYEDFVRQPAEELARILVFMGKAVPADEIATAVAGVSPRSLGKGRKALGAEEVLRLEKLVGESLKRYGYL